VVGSPRQPIAPEEETVIHVLAIITAKPGMREAILREFRANMPTVHAEKGCLEYAPAIDTPNMGKMQAQLGSDTFVVIEKWESTDALKAHAASAHMAAYAAKTKDLIENRVIHVLSPV
jgi:quinol monooxygenase YgiN